MEPIAKSTEGAQNASAGTCPVHCEREKEGKMAICRKCGGKLVEGDKVCRRCGAPVRQYKATRRVSRTPPASKSGASRGSYSKRRASGGRSGRVLIPIVVVVLVAIVIIVVIAAAGNGSDGTQSGTTASISTPTPTLAPTPTPTPTVTQTPMATPEPVNLTGTGQEATSKFHLNQGLAIFEMTHDGQSNFAIWLLDNQANKVELLVNEIGPFDGSKAVGISQEGDYLLDLAADGYWTVVITQPAPLSDLEPPLTLSGNAQQASDLFRLSQGLVTFQMKHDGQSNFAIWLMDSQGSLVELLVNEIGAFDGSKAVGIGQDGIFILDISADGNWTIVIEQ